MAEELEYFKELGIYEQMKDLWCPKEEELANLNPQDKILYDNILNVFIKWDPEKIIANGWDPNEYDIDAWIVLHMIFNKCNEEQILRYLLAADSEPDPSGYLTDEDVQIRISECPMIARKIFSLIK